MPNIESAKKEYEDILTQLSNPELILDWERFEELRERKGFLEKIIEKEKEIKDLKNKIEENKAIIRAREDPELVSLAEAEISQFLEKEKILEKELTTLSRTSLPPRSTQVKASAPLKQENFSSVIVEIRAGTGGKEAALFASDLFKMYSKYAKEQGWRQKILESRPTELSGVKEIIFELTPQQHAGGEGDIFSKMKYEGGVHRVQRIPETEKGGRIHTSTASVAVLPKPRAAQIKIRPEDLKIDFYRASGPGGQYVNKRETAVRITHLPTGLVVTSQTERNQLRNKENALSILAAKLLEKTQQEEEEKIKGKRRSQIGRAERAEKIRTYNFPQDRATDHRIKKSFHNLEEIMEGKLGPIISALQKSVSGTD